MLNTQWFLTQPVKKPLNAAYVKSLPSSGIKAGLDNHLRLESFSNSTVITFILG